MSFAGAVTACQSRMAAACDAQTGSGKLKGVAVTYPNEATADLTDAAAFIAFEVHGTQNTLRTLGSPGGRTFIHDGQIQASIFVPVQSGTGDAYDIADAVAALFEEAEFGTTVRCREASVSQGTMDAESGNWFRVTVYVNFSYIYAA